MSNDFIQYNPVANNVIILLNGSDVPITGYITGYAYDKGVLSKHIDGCTPNGQAVGVNIVQRRPTVTLVFNQSNFPLFNLMVGLDQTFDLTFQYYRTCIQNEILFSETAWQCKIGGDKMAGGADSPANIITQTYNCVNIT